MKRILYSLIVSLFFLSCKKSADTVAPSIMSISPSVGFAGTFVTINGSNFNMAAASNIVKFNGIAATIQSASVNSITVLAPAGATSGQVTVSSNGLITTGPNFTYADTAFSAFAPLSQAVPTGAIRGMDYDSVTKNLYIYVYEYSSPGYSILQYNTQTKTALTVFTETASWSNSNGSEGARIRVAQSSLYVMGGATNNIIHRLDGIGNNTLSLNLIWTLPSYNDPIYAAYFGEPYDLAYADKMYVMTMRNQITIFNLDFSANSLIPLKISSHGSSVVYVTSNGNNYLVSTGGGTGVIEVRDPSTGQFLRSVTVPPANGYTGLAKDGKGRVYYISQGKIYRWNADLLTQEVFQAKGSEEYNQFAVAEEGNIVRVYMTMGVSVNNAGSSFGVISMAIPD